MRPEHVAANELIDIALTGDREAYKAALTGIGKRFNSVLYDSITRNAARQYKSEVNDCRYVGWRADWISDKRRTEASE